VSPLSLLDIPPELWKERLTSSEFVPSYRVRQIARWVFQRDETDWHAMSDLPLEMREEWSRSFPFDLPSVDVLHKAKDGTRKIVFRLGDGTRIESVVIPRDDRATLCVSSQAGCAIGCRFCRTAEMGLIRNLTPGEMIGQVLLANRILKGEPIRDLSAEARIRRDLNRVNHIVFMGMGEPLANFDALVQTLRVLTSPAGFALSPRRITVSTSGLAGKIVELGTVGIPVNLAISLSAPTDPLRERLMPINSRYPIGAILKACREYPLKQRQRITFEYVLIGGVNDGTAEAQALAKLLAPFKSKVNLIPFNPYPGSPFGRPSDDGVRAFQEILLGKGVMATVRKTRGEEMLGACGQLAWENGPKRTKENSAWDPIVLSTPV
jgi:23S rRNA (adenine2503-C2)-methyltransferase